MLWNEKCKEGVVNREIALTECNQGPTYENILKERRKLLLP